MCRGRLYPPGLSRDLPDRDRVRLPAPLVTISSSAGLSEQSLEVAPVVEEPAKSPDGVLPGVTIPPGPAAARRGCGAACRPARRATAARRDQVPRRLPDVTPGATRASAGPPAWRARRCCRPRGRAAARDRPGPMRAHSRSSRATIRPSRQSTFPGWASPCSTPPRSPVLNGSIAASPARRARTRSTSRGSTNGTARAAGASRSARATGSGLRSAPRISSRSAPRTRRGRPSPRTTAGGNRCAFSTASIVPSWWIADRRARGARSAHTPVSGCPGRYSVTCHDRASSAPAWRSRG